MNLNDYTILKMNCNDLEKIKRYCKFWRDFFQSIQNDEADYVDKECNKERIITLNNILLFIDQIKNPPKLDPRHNETVKELTNNIFNKYKEWK